MLVTQTAVFVQTSQNFRSNFFTVCSSPWDVHTVWIGLWTKYFRFENSAVSGPATIYKL
jgi:hypothetical protein